MRTVLLVSSIRAYNKVLKFAESKSENVKRKMENCKCYANFLIDYTKSLDKVILIFSLKKEYLGECKVVKSRSRKSIFMEHEERHR